MSAFALALRYWRLLALVAAIGGLLWALHAYGSRREGEGYDRAVAEAEAASERQREANRATAREAEEKESVRTVYRDRFIIKTVKEIEYAAAPLATCPVPADVLRLLRDAATCAKSDRSGACGSDAAVSNP